MRKIGVIDYRAGNSESVAAALEAINVPFAMVASPGALPPWMQLSCPEWDLPARRWTRWTSWA